MKIKYLLTTILLPVSLWTNAAPFTVSADGHEVTDIKTGLIWRRCAEGMTAGGGSCAGTPSAFTHEAALTRASTQATTAGVAWRLPNVKELSSIADRSREVPAIDVAAFPDTPATIFWSSSPYVGNAYFVWSVDFRTGNGDHGAGHSNGFEGHVRLVRVSQ